MNPDDTQMASPKPPDWIVDRARRIIGCALLGGILSDDATIQDARNLSQEVIEAMMDALNMGKCQPPDSAA